MSKTISERQAKTLAWLWAEDRKITFSASYTPPTWAALKRRGYVEETGKTIITPSGAPGYPHRISEAGVVALATFLWNRAHHNPRPWNNRRAKP